MASSDEALQRSEELEDASGLAALDEQNEAEIEVRDASKEEEEEAEASQGMSAEEDELHEHDESELPSKEVHEQAGGEPSLPKSFPLSKVKKIVRLDKDIKLVARPALVAISQAAQLFIESLTAEAFSASLTSKRKSLRLADLETAVRSKRKFLDFLDDSMDIFAEATNHDKEDAESSKSKPSADKSSLPPPGTRCITDFFT